MITSVIVEDEAKSRETLSTLLGRYCPGVAVAGSAACIREAVSLIDTVRPPLVFLDIALPDGSGFDLLSQVTHTGFELIFITASNEYAIRAIKAHAIDYLLKPLNILELQGAVEHAEQRIREKAGPNIESLLSRLEDPRLKKKLAIPVADGLKFIPVPQIIRLFARGSYTEIFTTSGSVLSSHLLKEYEHKLPSSDFFRVHHSHIINLSCIKHYHRGDGGYLTMTDGSVIDISKRRKAAFLELFQF